MRQRRLWAAAAPPPGVETSWQSRRLAWNASSGQPSCVRSPSDSAAAAASTRAFSVTTCRMRSDRGGERRSAVSSVASRRLAIPSSPHTRAHSRAPLVVSGCRVRVAIPRVERHEAVAAELERDTLEAHRPTVDPDRSAPNQVAATVSTRAPGVSALAPKRMKPNHGDTSRAAAHHDDLDHRPCRDLISPSRGKTLIAELDVSSGASGGTAGLLVERPSQDSVG